MDILTTQGFINTYFQLLPNCTTQLEAFDTVNNTVYAITKNYPYQSLEDFRANIFST